MPPGPLCQTARLTMRTGSTAFRLRSRCGLCLAALSAVCTAAPSPLRAVPSVTQPTRPPFLARPVLHLQTILRPKGQYLGGVPAVAWAQVQKDKNQFSFQGALRCAAGCAALRSGMRLGPESLHASRSLPRPSPVRASVHPRPAPPAPRAQARWTAATRTPPSGSPRRRATCRPLAATCSTRRASRRGCAAAGGTRWWWARCSASWAKTTRTPSM